MIDAAIRHAVGDTAAALRELLHPDGRGVVDTAFPGAHGLDWQTLLHHAGQCLVTTSLAIMIERRGQRAHLPPDVGAALDAIVSANGARNRMLLEEASGFAATLVRAGIVPVAIKGIALLAEARFADPGERIASDIDLLVRPEELPAALAALRDAGHEQQRIPYVARRAGRMSEFGPIDPREYRNDPSIGFYHVPAIRRPGGTAHLELHAHVAAADSDLARWLNARVPVGTRPIRNRFANLDVPSTAVRLLHNFHHSQLKDGLGRLGTLDWRHLLDARALLADEPDPNATLATLRAVARETGTGDELELHLWQLRHWVGVDVPDDGEASGTGARRRIDDFERTRTDARRADRRRRARLWRTRARNLLSPTQLRRYYGPVPWAVAVGIALRYRAATSLHRLRGTRPGRGEGKRGHR